MCNSLYFDIDCHCARRQHTVQFNPRHQLNRWRSQLKPLPKPPSENEKSQLRIKPKERRCGTFVLRQGLDALSEIERVRFFKELEELGLPPVV